MGLYEVGLYEVGLYEVGLYEVGLCEMWLINARSSKRSKNERGELLPPFLQILPEFARSIY